MSNSQSQEGNKRNFQRSLISIDIEPHVARLNDHYDQMLSDEDFIAELHTFMTRERNQNLTVRETRQFLKVVRKESISQVRAVDKYVFEHSKDPEWMTNREHHQALIRAAPNGKDFKELARKEFDGNLRLVGMVPDFLTNLQLFDDLRQGRCWYVEARRGGFFIRLPGLICGKLCDWIFGKP